MSSRNSDVEHAVNLTEALRVGPQQQSTTVTPAARTNRARNRAARISALRLRPVSTADLSDGCSDSSFSNHSQASSPGTLSSPHSPNLLARSSDTSQVGLSSGNTQRAQSTSGSGAAIIGSSPRFTTLGASASAAASSFPQPHISLNSNDVLDTESSRRQAAFYNVSLARSPGARATTASIAPPNFTGESSPGISSVARSLRGAQGRRGRTASFALPPRARSILRASSRSPDLRLHGQSDLHSHLAGASTTGGRKQYRGPRLSGGFEAQANLGSNSINDGHGTMAHEPGTRGARSKTPQPVLLRHQPPLHSSHQLSSQHKQSGSKHRSIRRSASREDHTLDNRHCCGARRRNPSSRSPSVEQQDLRFSSDAMRPSTLQARNDPSTPSHENDSMQRRPSESENHSFSQAVAEAAALAAAAHAATTDVGSGTGGASTRSAATPSATTVPLTQLSMDYFTVVGTIGHGAFGKVMLVRDKVNKKPYALKVLSKAFIARHGSFLSVRQEIETLKLCRGHPYIVQLHFAFQDARYVFMVLDFVRGGSLDSIISADGPLTGRQTLFFGAQLVLSLGHLHACGLVYFDLKLENILVHTSGHLALADMGLSYRQDRLMDEAPLICGTPAYMAPEQVRCGGNGLLSEEIQKTVDWWALGLVLYETNTGIHPFHSGSNLKANFVKILKCEVDYRGMSEALACLIRALLHTDYRRRLGYGPDGTRNVQAHPAFNGKSTRIAPAAAHSHRDSTEPKSAGGSVHCRSGRTGSVGRDTHGDGGIYVDWTALAARTCKPLFLPEQRSIVDKDDIDIEYGMDPRSRSNTAAHRSAAAAELSPESKDEFTKKLAPFRADDGIAEPDKRGRSALAPKLPDEDPSSTTTTSRSHHLPLRRSSTAGPLGKRSTSVDSGLNQMGGMDSVVAMQQPSHWGNRKDERPSSTAGPHETAGRTSSVGNLPDELDIRVNAVTSTDAQWRAAHRTPRSGEFATTR